MNRMIEVKYIPEYSIVRLPDGREGFLSKHTPTGKPWVMFVSDLGIEVGTHDYLELVLFPAECVRMILEQRQEARTEP